MGGGPDRAISLLELLDHMGALHGRQPAVRRGAWRLGDQRYYVSNTRKFTQATGWQPQVGLLEGITMLNTWLVEQPAHGPLVAALPALDGRLPSGSKLRTAVAASTDTAAYGGRAADIAALPSRESLV
jgi:hypothetical protein